MSHETIRVLIADDHPIVREGLRTILGFQEGIEVVGEASDGLEAVDLAQKLLPEVVLMDIRMSKLNGVEATRRIKAHNPQIGVIVLTNYDDDRYVFEGVEAGASGYLLKDISSDELSEAIHRVARGESLMAPSVLRKVLDEFAHRAEERELPHEGLTPRELEVLQALAQGLKNEEIAKELFITGKTVKSHLGSIFSKLGVNDRSQAILYAIKHKLVDID
ncbi:MAG: response regulator transcription factor [Anaerolineae bacterium]|jgi:two-component system NarL family response regulator